MPVSGYKKSKYQNQLASVNFRLKMVKEVFGALVKEPNEMAVMFEEVLEACAGRGEANSGLWSDQNFQSLREFCMYVQSA